MLDALAAERSVTRAGHRLGLSQSSVSHALGRLRERLGDELFVKGPDGMVPTPRARTMAPRIHAALAALQAALSDAPFDPAASEQRFTIAADPYVRAILLPPLITLLREEAPGVQLRVKPGFAGVSDALDNGELDFAIASYRQIPDRFGAVDILEERLIWALRRDHPAATGTLSLASLGDLPHLVRVVPGADDASDDLPITGRGLVRRAIQDDDGAFARAIAGNGPHHGTRLTVPDSFAALAMVGASDLAALVPARMARQLAGHFNLALFDPPYPSPSVPISAVWDLGHGATPAATWMLDLIQRAAAQVTADPPSRG